MRLYFTATSPFVRKVMIVAREVGIELETEFLRPSPLEVDLTLSKENPLSKIPVLMTPDGPLYDSPVICEYIDAHNQLTPSHGAPRFRVLRLQALCDGILDAGILVYYEHQHRPKELRWQPWADGNIGKVMQGLDALEREVESFGEIDLAQVCVGVTLGWLEFRNAVGHIRAGRPKLFHWYDTFRERPSMRETEPRV